MEGLSFQEINGMTPVYCTLFDKNYISRGVVLIESLQRVCPDFRLYVFAFDRDCEEILYTLNYPNVRIIGLDDFMDEDLRRLRAERTIAEFCWTCTPSTVWYILNHFEEDHCTYIDADMEFYASPQPLLHEMEGYSVMITLHRYTHDEGLSEMFGKYCVQYVSFRNDEKGRIALKWWRDACLEWCYNRVEAGRFGDQKYLDDWTERFDGVKVCENHGCGMATWNIRRYRLQKNNTGIRAVNTETGERFQCIFYHYHGLKFYTDGIVQYTVDPIGKEVCALFYRPYVQKLLKAGERIHQIQKSFNPHATFRESPKKPLGLRDKLYLYRTQVLRPMTKLRWKAAGENYRKLNSEFKAHHYYWLSDGRNN
jgi:hypothetical protein